MVRPKCFYCGKPLSAQLLEAAAATAAQAIQELQQKLPAPAAAAPDAPTPSQRRLLVVLDLRAAEAKQLARALGLNSFEARQLLRRGGHQLQKIVPEPEARSEAARLGSAGLRAVLLDEASLPREPLLVYGGKLEPQRLSGRGDDGRFEWARDDLLLVVKGPIQREYQAETSNLRRVKTASPSPGYRFHLHRRSDPRPLELDPDAFEFDAERGKPGSSMLRLAAWIEAFTPKAPVDDGFRLLPPALGASEAGDETSRALGRAPRPKGAALMLDNLRQFRFYSAWRAAVERSA